MLSWIIRMSSMRNHCWKKLQTKEPRQPLEVILRQATESPIFALEDAFPILTSKVTNRCYFKALNLCNLLKNK
jgi:hypothetical protein